jgi:hypothetical protein
LGVWWQLFLFASVRVSLNGERWADGLINLKIEPTVGMLSMIQPPTPTTKRPHPEEAGSDPAPKRPRLEETDAHPDNETNLLRAFRETPAVLAGPKAEVENLEAQVGVLFSGRMDRYDSGCSARNQKCRYPTDRISWPHMCNGKLPENAPGTLAELNKIDPLVLEALCEGYGINVAPARTSMPRRVKVPRRDRALDWERLCVLKIRLGVLGSK